MTFIKGHSTSIPAI